ncbi:MAG: glycoside hydrolase family 6 protein [Nocardioidaceae bacterium]
MRGPTARLAGWVVLCLGGALLLGGCSSGLVAALTPGASPTSALGDDVRFYVDPEGHAPEAVAALRLTGRTEESRRLDEQIARHPSATWLTDVPEAVFAEARHVTTAAKLDGSVPVLVAYNLPGRDCGQYSAGGAEDIDAYLSWVGSLAAGIGDQPAVVVLEPDAVAHGLQGCGSTASNDERFRMLKEAVTILKRQPEARVYVDAGNASWVRDLDALAAALRSSGVARADGFALNVSNFETTQRSATYGEGLSRRLDGARFVIDTSRNGAGPPARSADPASHASWCNPPGRALGSAPTTRTSHAQVDALLWVKQPGDSDGACRAGAPPAGQWWPAYAADLMATASR